MQKLTDKVVSIVPNFLDGVVASVIRRTARPRYALMNACLNLEPINPVANICMGCVAVFFFALAACVNLFL